MMNAPAPGFLSPKNIALGVAALAVLALGGCSTFGGDETAFECPRVSIINASARLVQFTPGTPEVTENIVNEIRMDNFLGTCEYDPDGAQMDVELSPHGTMFRGRANPDGVARFAYFVAVMKADGTLAARERFDMDVAYPRGTSSSAWKDEIPVRLTLPLGPGENPSKWRVFTGLQLSRAELRHIMETRPGAGR